MKNTEMRNNLLNLHIQLFYVGTQSVYAGASGYFRMGEMGELINRTIRLLEHPSLYCFQENEVLEDVLARYENLDADSILFFEGIKKDLAEFDYSPEWLDKVCPVSKEFVDGLEIPKERLKEKSEISEIVKNRKNEEGW